MNKSILIFASIIALLFVKLSFAMEETIINKKPKKTTISQIDQSNFVNKAILQSLNKITAKTKRLEINVGEEIEFGKLDILIHKCWKAPLYEKPENKILLEIFNRDSNKKERERIFYGWMLSSSPSLSSLEHPIYDITALECINNDNENGK